jgi:hypothetical protein
VEYSFLGEFDLLRNSREDVQQAIWAQPARRAATVKYFKLCRAREEIELLNLEMRRLRTSIHDETVHTESVIDSLSHTDPHLCIELRRRWALRLSVNAVHIQRLDEVENSTGFTGQKGIGIRLGAKKNSGVPDKVEGTQTDAAADLDEDDEVDRDLQNFTEFVLHITD